MLKEGQKAPNFKLPDQDGKTVSLSYYKGKAVLLYFYPKDMTPGCTIEACDARDAIVSKAIPKEMIVLGVSADKPDKHQKFISKYDLNFTLLSDESHEVLDKYGAWNEKRSFGKTFFGIVRTTYLIGKDGKILKIYKNVKAKGHIDKVIEDYKLLVAKN
jgi:peroxiredoxin Q/BCP